MKITETYLRQVIKEELDGVMAESGGMVQLIQTIMKNHKGVTTKPDIINWLNGQLAKRPEVKSNEYDTLAGSIKVILNWLESGNFDNPMQIDLTAALARLIARAEKNKSEQPGANIDQKSDNSGDGEADNERTKLAADIEKIPQGHFSSGLGRGWTWEKLRAATQADSDPKELKAASDEVARVLSARRID